MPAQLFSYGIHDSVPTRRLSPSVSGQPEHDFLFIILIAHRSLFTNKLNVMII